MQASCCLPLPLKKRSNKEMKQQKLSQLPRLGNQRSSFFEEGPFPITGHDGEAKNVASGTTRLLIPEGGIHSELGVKAEEDFKVPNHNQTKILIERAAQSGNRYVQSF